MSDQGQHFFSLSNEEFTEYDKYNKNIAQDRDPNQGEIHINLVGSGFSMDSKNEREKTFLQIPEINYSLFSDIQLCSILDTIIFGPQGNYKNLIEPIMSKGQICDIDYISSFFQIFGFESYTTNNLNKERVLDEKLFFDLVLPFIPNDNELRNKYISDKINQPKSLHLWLKYGFPRDGEEFDKKFYEKFDILPYLKTPEVNKETLFFLHHVGVALQLKFTNVYIQDNNPEGYCYKAFNLGDSNATNRIFIGMYKNDGNIFYYIPKLLMTKKDEKCDFYANNPFDDLYRNFIFLPNYGPIYLKESESRFFPYYQCNKSSFYLNNDYPIFINDESKEITLSLTSLSLTRLYIQTLLSKGQKPQSNDTYKKMAQIVFKEVFNLPINIDTTNASGIIPPSNFISERKDFYLHLLPPINTLSYVPNLKITSPLNIVNVMINSLSRIFFISTYEQDDNTTIFFGDGDFGSSNLDDMFICPTSIETGKLISSFIIPSQISFQINTIDCIHPGIIVLHHRNGNDYNTVTHYSRTEHIWQKQNEFDLDFKCSEEDTSIFFCLFGYYIFYKDKNEFKVRAYKFNPKHHKSEEQEPEDISLPDDIKGNIESIHFYNNKFYVITNDQNCWQILEELNNNFKKEEIDQDNFRVKHLLIQHDEEIEKDFSFRIDFDKKEYSIELTPIALEINQRVHVFKLEDNQISSFLYHPANKNANLYYSILSMFYRYRRNFKHEIYDRGDEDKPYIIHTCIDCSYSGNFNEIFQSGTCPGIYFETKIGPGENLPNSHPFFDCWSDPPNILNLYFNNGLHQTGLTELRTLSQLAASFACSFAISVYNSRGKVICYKPPQQNTVLWTFEAFQKMERNLIATYGTLLEMKNDYEFEFALNVLETTKCHVAEFKKFLHSISIS